MLKVAKEKYRTIIKYGILLAAYVFLVLFMRGNINRFLDADASSELILSQILSEDGGILSDKWYYSTELRVVNTQIIYSLMFRIFSNWHQVRVFGNAVLYLCMLLSAFYFCRGARLTKYFPYIGTILLFPLSDIYFNNVLVGGYYITHISLSFLIIGSVLSYVHCQGVQSKAIIILLSIGFSVVAGLGGIRLPFVLFVPLTIVALGTVGRDYRKNRRGKPVENTSLKKKFIFVVGISDVAAAIGYFINAGFLSKQYSYKDFSDMNWRSISLEDLCGAINGFLESWGYHTGVSFFSLFSIANVLFLIIFAGIVWWGFKNRTLVWQMNFEAKITVLYFVTAVVFYSLFRMVSGYGIDRHNLSIAAFMFPACFCLVDVCQCCEGHSNQLKVWKGILTLTVADAMVCYLAYWTSSGNQEKLQVANYLENHSECAQGWASFWNGNIMSELTNGKCEMWVWDADSSENEPVIFQWLQKKAHDEVSPSDKCFYLFSIEEYQLLSWAWQFDLKDAVYCSEQYVIFEK